MTAERNAHGASDIRLDWPDGGEGECANRPTAAPDPKLTWSEAAADEETRDRPGEQRRMRLRLRASAASATSASPPVAGVPRVKELEQEVERLRALVRRLGGDP